MDSSFGSGPAPAGSASLPLPHGNSTVAIVAGNQTGPLDASASRASKSYRPQAYVHIEFGLSWSQGHLPNSHAVTYQSKALRDQLATTGHQLPTPQATQAQTQAQTQNLAPPITTSASAPVPQPQTLLLWDATRNVYLKPNSRTTAQQRAVAHRHSSVDLAHRHRLAQSTHRHSSIEPISARPAQYRQTPAPSLWERHTASDPQEQQRHQWQPPRMLTPVYEYESSTSTRQVAWDIRSERGHSEPPSLNPNQWAFAPYAAHPTGLGNAQQYAMHNTRSFASPSAWKPLPDTPARFRLGKDAISGAEEGPGADPDDERILQSPGTTLTPAIVLHIPEKTPIILPIQSPLPDAPRYREIDPKRRKDMQVLSEAMMWGPESQSSTPSSAVAAHAVPGSGTSPHARTLSGGSAHRSNSVHHSIAYSESNYDEFEEEALSEPQCLVATAWPRRSSAPLMERPPLRPSTTMPSTSKAPLPPLSCATATTKGAHAPLRSTSIVSAASAVSAVSAASAVSASAVSAVSAMSRTGTPGPNDPAGRANEQYVVSPLSTTTTMTVSPLNDTGSHPALFTRPWRSTSEGSIMPWSPSGTAQHGTSWGASYQQPQSRVREDELFFD